MKVIQENSETHIIADDGKCLIHKDENVPFYEVWLAKDDTVDNWIETDDVIVETEEK